jgi:hypothetical protein
MTTSRGRVGPKLVDMPAGHWTAPPPTSSNQDLIGGHTRGWKKAKVQRDGSDRGPPLASRRSAAGLRPPRQRSTDSGKLALYAEKQCRWAGSYRQLTSNARTRANERIHTHVRARCSPGPPELDYACVCRRRHEEAALPAARGLLQQPLLGARGPGQQERGLAVALVAGQVVCCWQPCIV